MEIVYFVVLNALGHLAFVGARMTTTLFALELGASEFTVGVLMSLFALLPTFLSVGAGRLIDRAGPQRPLEVSFGILALATALPFAFPSLATLYVSATLLGVSFMYVHIAMNSVFGAHGLPEERAVNFSWLALGFSISNSIGPLVAGYAIDGLGYARAFAVLAVFPAIALALLWARKQPLPRPEHVPRAARAGVLDLLRIPGLQRAFWVSLLLATGWDLYTFLIPLYGARIGLSAAAIGVILSTFAVATFTVRLAMPLLIKKLKQWLIIFCSLAISGACYLLFPLAQSVPPLLLLSFVLGLGLGSAQPVIMSLLYAASPPGRQGEAVGLRTSLLNGSHTLIPLASGAASAAVGMAPVFWVLAAGLLAGAWFARKQVGKNPP
ncbi:MAG TPA: MFS transporter [Burkholderiales bacterium]|nr:MFS transporter [Burkholderiales bacterium]